MIYGLTLFLAGVVISITTACALTGILNPALSASVLIPSVVAAFAVNR